MTGFTLPGMIDEPGCTAGIAISAIPARGPHPSRRRSLAILYIETATARSAPLADDHGVQRRLAAEVVPGLPERDAEVGREQRDHLGRELRVGADAGPDRGSPERQLGERGDRLLAAQARPLHLPA